MKISFYKKLLFILLFTILYSCSDKEKNSFIIPPNFNEVPDINKSVDVNKKENIGNQEELDRLKKILNKN